VWEFPIEEAGDERPSVRRRALCMFLVFWFLKGQHVDLRKSGYKHTGRRRDMEIITMRISWETRIPLCSNT
jgi:hypothetical protein